MRKQYILLIFCQDIFDFVRIKFKGDTKLTTLLTTYKIYKDKVENH